MIFVCIRRGQGVLLLLQLLLFVVQPRRVVGHVSITTRAAAQHTAAVAPAATVTPLSLILAMAGSLAQGARRRGGHATQAGLGVVGSHQGVLRAGQGVGPRARAGAGVRVGTEGIGIAWARDHHAVHRGGLAESGAEHTRALCDKRIIVYTSTVSFSGKQMNDVSTQVCELLQQPNAYNYCSNNN